MLKSPPGLQQPPMRAHLEPGCTWPSQAIMAARPVAFEAARAPDRCRAGELQHSRRKVCARRMSRGPCLYVTQVTAHSQTYASHTRTYRVSVTGKHSAVAYVPTEDGRVILPSCGILRRRHDEGGG